MSARTVSACPHRDETLRLAREEFDPAARAAAEHHLESCDACRAAFRREVDERYPTKFRNYTIIGHIGEGGFGVVYKAIHHSKRRTEALKVLYAKSPARAAYFSNEVHLIARLRHPNIATLYEAHLKSPPMYYTMEYVDGEHLDAYLRSNPVGLEPRLNLIKKVAAAIAHAHARGVVHRDLKPQNILIDASGEPRIVDFGIARGLGLEDETPDPARREHEGALGTFGYISPEQMAGQPVDGRADIYALGVLLFHVITGAPARLAPFRDRLDHLLRERQVARAADLAEIIQRCVQVEPARRYADCAALVADLDNYLSGRPISAYRHPAPGYRVARAWTSVLRNHPGAVRATLVIATAAALSLFLRAAGAHWLHEGEAAQTVLVAFGPNTLAALRAGALAPEVAGLDAANRKSWRLLHGRLLEQISAARPRVIAWDYYFPDSQPDFDPAFIQAAQRSSAPVVVGFESFDLNAEPRIAPEIAAAVHSTGLLIQPENPHAGADLSYAWCLQRGLNPPIPTLAVAAFAAARFPDCTAEFHVSGDVVELRYRRRTPGAGEARYLDTVDRLPVQLAHEAPRGLATLWRTDVMQLGRVRADLDNTWTERTIPYESVLTADLDQRRRWFDGRAVVVGQVTPGEDEYQLGGRRLFGVQVHAAALDALLGDQRMTPIGKWGLVLRLVAWCALAAVLVSIVPVRATWLLRSVAVGGALISLAGWLLAGYVATRVAAVPAAEAGIGLSALLAAGGVVLIARVARERQLHLSPTASWSPAEPTASSTVVAPAEGGAA